MSRLVDGDAGEFIAASADLALDIGLAGLVTRWREAEIRAHVADRLKRRLTSATLRFGPPRDLCRCRFGCALDEINQIVERRLQGN